MANILDKTDKSQAPVPSKDGNFITVSKHKKYNWAPVGDWGVFMFLAKESLSIDGDYQREQVSERKVQEIASSFDPVLFGVLIVFERKDGSRWVGDGGHRVRASFLRDDVRYLPCIVYKVEDLSSEARAFLGLNTMKTNVGSTDKFKASITANEELAVKTDGILKSLSIEVSKRASKKHQVKCISTVIECIKEDEPLAIRCMQLLLKMHDEIPIDNKVLRGIFYLCRRLSSRVDVLDKHGHILADCTQAYIKSLIDMKEIELKGVRGDKVAALAVMDIINKRLRGARKLTWDVSE